MPRKVQYTIEELTCPECGFVAINANGLRGHRQFKHGVRPSGAQLPLQKQDLLVSESKLAQLLDERFGVVGEQINQLAGVVDELQVGFPRLLEQLNQPKRISDFPLSEQARYLEGALRTLDAEATAILLQHAGKADMLRPATDVVEGHIVDEDQQAKEADLAEFVAEMTEKEAKRKAEELVIEDGKRDEPGWRYLSHLDISIKKGAD
ncbi:unnamed protein product [marine sediment metagenome]|uniref:Uncharacterized protein n=1 Tax=marine sediment metagenome TaxID=412755 RepID=X1SM07_9ZZZZ